MSILAHVGSEIQYSPDAAMPGELLDSEATRLTTPELALDELDALITAARPKVVYISHKQGPGSGGTSVTILGNYFTGVTEVLFGDAPADFKVPSSNRIVAVAPPHDPGVVQVRISTAAAVSEPVPFVYQAVPVLAELKPTHGPTRGGTLVVIHGGNFVTDRTKVFFGKRQGKDVKVLSSRLLVAKSPQAEAGVVSVVVTTPDGVSCEASYEYA